VPICLPDLKLVTGWSVPSELKRDSAPNAATLKRPFVQASKKGAAVSHTISENGKEICDRRGHRQELVVSKAPARWCAQRLVTVAIKHITGQLEML